MTFMLKLNVYCLTSYQSHTVQKNCSAFSDMDKGSRQTQKVAIFLLEFDPLCRARLLVVMVVLIAIDDFICVISSDRLLTQSA